LSDRRIGVVSADVCVLTWWSLVAMGRGLGGIRGYGMFRNDAALVHLASTAEPTSSHTHQYASGN